MANNASIKLEFDKYGEFLPVRGTVAELRLYPTLTLRSGDMIKTSGQNDPLDGLGADWAWNPSSQAADDGASVVQPGNLPAGRWTRIVNSLGIVANSLGTATNIAPSQAAVGAALKAASIVKNSLAELKATDTSYPTAIYAGDIWLWTPGDFSGKANDVTITSSSSVPISSGAWVRQNLSGGIPVELFGINATNSAAVNTPLFHTMWDFAAGRLTRLGEGRYRYNGSYAGSVNMQGERMPTVNPGRTALEGGSILEGTTSFSGPVAILRDLGVDHGSGAFSSGADAIKLSANPYNRGRLALLQNVVGLGRGDNDAFHAVLVEGYGKALLSNVTGSTNQYCFAIKSRSVNFSGLHAIGGQNGIIFKSDGSGPGTGSLSNVAGQGIVIEGNANTAYGVRVLADTQSISNLTISNIDINSVGYGVVIETAVGVAISELQISNVNGRDIRNFGVQTGGAGALYEAQFNNFNLVDLGDYVGQFQNGNIKLNNFYGSLKAGSIAHVATALRCEATLTALSINNMELVENYGAGTAKPALYLAIPSTLVRLNGEMRYVVEANVPEPGTNSQALNGTTAKINPLPDLNGRRSTCIITVGAATTVTAINQVMPDTNTNYPRGYQVTILNAGGSLLTFQNNGNIRTRSDAATTDVPVNKTITFTWLGSSWHQVN